MILDSKNTRTTTKNNSNKLIFLVKLCLFIISLNKGTMHCKVVGRGLYQIEIGHHIKAK